MQRDGGHGAQTGGMFGSTAVERFHFAFSGVEK